MSDQLFDSSTDFSACIADAPAPADFNPDAKAFEQAPPGLWLMEVVDFKVALDKEFKAKVDGVKQSFFLTQLRPQLRIVGGPHDGASANDFLPVPTPNREMPTLYANQWANFIKSLGFELPVGPDGKARLMPAGFALQQIKGRRCMVKIVPSTNSDGTAKLNNQGEPFTEPAFFGYSRPETAGSNGNTKPAPAALNKPANVGLNKPANAGRAPLAASQPVGVPIDIGDL